MTTTPPARRDEALEALAEAWNAELWEPIRFEIGDRVRCIPSPECRTDWISDWAPRGHPPEETGVWGTVERMPERYWHEPWARSHPYAVRFDSPGIFIGGTVWWGGMFAAIELEPLPTPDAGGGTEA